MSYSIVSGNDLRQFAIGDRSGIITVIRKLDREDLTRYQLVSCISLNLRFGWFCFYYVFTLSLDSDGSDFGLLLFNRCHGNIGSTGFTFLSEKSI